MTRAQRFSAPTFSSVQANTSTTLSYSDRETTLYVHTYVPRSWVFGFPMTPRRHPPPAPGRQTRLPLQRSFPPRAKSIIAQDERQASPLSLTSHSHDSRLHRQSPQGGHFFPPFFGRFWASMCAYDWVLQLLLPEH